MEEPVSPTHTAATVGPNRVSRRIDGGPALQVRINPPCPGHRGAERCRSVCVCVCVCVTPVNADGVQPPFLSDAQFAMLTRMRPPRSERDFGGVLRLLSEDRNCEVDPARCTSVLASAWRRRRSSSDCTTATWQTWCSTAATS